MKKRSIWSRMGEFLLGKGFYMVLLLCVLAIGASGYYLYTLASAGMAARSLPVTVPAQLPQAEEGLPILEEEEAEEVLLPRQEPVPQPQREEPVQPQEPAEPAQPLPKQEPVEPQETTETELQPPEEPKPKGPLGQLQVAAAFSDQELVYHPVLEDWRTHNGVDLTAQLGEEVAAVMDGQVLMIEEDVLLGTKVTLNHGEGLWTVYANLSPELSVEQGDHVAAGQVIGCVGETAQGERHEAPWLHFAVERDGLPVDPMAYLPE